VRGGCPARSSRPWGLAQRMLGGQQWTADVVAPPSFAVWPTDHLCIMTPSLYVTRSATSSQCKSSCKISVRPWSNFLVLLTTRAAAFITRCRVPVSDFVAPASKALHWSTREVTNVTPSRRKNATQEKTWSLHKTPQAQRSSHGGHNTYNLHTRYKIIS